MKSHSRYAFAALRRLRVEGVTTIITASIALAAIAIAYAIATSVDTEISKTVAELRARSPVWLLPSSGLRVADAAGGLTPRTAFRPDVLQRIRMLPDATQSKLLPIHAEESIVSGTPALVYYLPAASSNRMILDERSPGDEFATIVRQARPSAELVRRNIGRSVVLVEGDTLGRRLGLSAVPNWFLVDPSSLQSIISQLRERGVRVQVEYGPGAFGADSRNDCLFAVIDRLPAARFTPFSLSTQLSAYVVNSVLATKIGLLARSAFLFAMVVVVISARTTVRARRNEIAVFAVFGLEGDLAAVLAIEAAITAVVALAVATGITVTILTPVLGMNWRDNLGPLALAAVFAAILALIDALTRALACTSMFERRNLDAYA